VSINARQKESIFSPLFLHFSCFAFCIINIRNVAIYTGGFTMKKIIALVLVCILSVSVFEAPCFAKAADTIMPCYENVTTGKASLAIDDNGKATISVRCIGVAGTTSIRAVTYMEKLVNGSWERVDIASANDQWTAQVTTTYYINTLTHQLTSTGTYRAVCKFTVTAGTVETVTYTSQATY
jgi:hypothetical protein